MKYFLFVGTLLIAFSFVRCTCDCPSGDLNSVSFNFNLGISATSFKDAEVDTIMVYKLTKNTSVKIDSASIYTKSFTLSQSGINYSGDFWLYDYLVKTQGNKDFLITDIQIESAQQNTRCKCFVNTAKKLKVNGTAYDFSGKVWTESNVTLSK